MIDVLHKIDIMERTGGRKTRVFKGAGILLGFTAGILAGILWVIMTGITGLIGAVAASFSIPLGIYFESRFQGRKIGHQPGARGYLYILTAGAILLSAMLFLVK